VIDYPFNSFVDDENFTLAVGQDLVVPDGEMPKGGLLPQSNIARILTPNAGSVSAIGQFVWPTSGVITQGFKFFHQGMDIANRAGGNVLAADAGRVTVAGWTDNTGYGNRIMIDHGNGYITLYGHLSLIQVQVGQTVKRGDVIGQMGNTGRSTGTHLHFEIRHGGVHENPLGYLK
jgi:murein DD-endopeptidase MepM/ murein hydrolase activator NlpD